MIRIDARRVRHDLGPCPAPVSRSDVTLPTGYHEEQPFQIGCAVCGERVTPGRYTCSPEHHRTWMGRLHG